MAGAHDLGMANMQENVRNESRAGDSQQRCGSGWEPKKEHSKKFASQPTGS